MIQDTVRLIHVSDYKVMPWKNGGGTTTELIIEPAGASLDAGFLWRLSMAEVGVSGPFSRFDGCDRTLLLMAGRGMRLDFEGRESASLEALFRPVSFSGDWSTSGMLVDGPCRDFNVITHRAHCHHRLEVRRLDSHPRPMLEAEVRFAFCAEGKARVEPLGIELSTWELLRIEGLEERLQMSSLGNAETTLISVGIDRVKGTRSRHGGSVLS